MVNVFTVQILIFITVGLAVLLGGGILWEGGCLGDKTDFSPDHNLPC